jgi:hypothetical protein
MARSRKSGRSFVRVITATPAAAVRGAGEFHAAFSATRRDIPEPASLSGRRNDVG